MPTPAPRGQVQLAGGRGPVPDTLPGWLPQSLASSHSQERSPHSPRPARDPGLAWGRSREARAPAGAGAGLGLQGGAGASVQECQDGDTQLSSQGRGWWGFWRNDGGGDRPGPPRAAPPRLALCSAQRLQAASQAKPSRRSAGAPGSPRPAELLRATALRARRLLNFLLRTAAPGVPCSSNPHLLGSRILTSQGRVQGHGTVTQQSRDTVTHRRESPTQS